jgi:hypothetical protein
LKGSAAKQGPDATPGLGRAKRINEALKAGVAAGLQDTPHGSMWTVHWHDAEKPAQPVIPKSRRRRGISQVLCLQSEIPRFARNDDVRKGFSAS